MLAVRLHVYQPQTTNRLQCVAWGACKRGKITLQRRFARQWGGGEGVAASRAYNSEVVWYALIVDVRRYCMANILAAFLTPQSGHWQQQYWCYFNFWQQRRLHFAAI